MGRSMITGIAVAFALTVAVLGRSGITDPVRADASSVSSDSAPSAALPVELVTQEELCAFRAPVLIESDTVPIACLSVVEWLRRVINADIACGETWLERGTIPECALPYR